MFFFKSIIFIIACWEFKVDSSLQVGLGDQLMRAIYIFAQSTSKKSAKHTQFIFSSHIIAKGVLWEWQSSYQSPVGPINVVSVTTEVK